MGFLSSLKGFLGMKNPAEAAQPYLENLPGELNPYYQPYIDMGQRQMPGLESQYQQLMTDPASRMAEFGGSFQESPGAAYTREQALRASNQAQAAGGMLGTPQNQLLNAEISAQLANKDYYNYLDRVMGMYGQGLSGSQGLMDRGQQAGMSFADQLANIRASQANLAFAGSQAENEQTGGIIGGVGSAVGQGLGWLFNPAGQAVKSAAGAAKSKFI